MSGPSSSVSSSDVRDESSRVDEWSSTGEIGEGRESMEETRDVLAKQRGREGRRRTRTANLVERHPERCFDFYERGLYYDEDAVLTSLASEILPPSWMKMPSRA